MGMNSVTNIGRNGIQDWIIQRVTAYVLALYTLFLLGFFVTTDVDSVQPGLVQDFQPAGAVVHCRTRLGRLVDRIHRLHQSSNAALPAAGSLHSGDVRICRVGHSDSVGALIDG